MNVPNRTSKLTYSAYIDNTDGNDEASVKIWFRNADDSAYVDGTSADGTKIPVGSAGWSTIVFDPSVRPNTYIIKPGLKLNNATASQPMIEFGDTRTAYEPYSGESFPVAFPSGQTIYGGSLDLVSGVLTVEWYGCYASSLEWSNSSLAASRGIFMTFVPHNRKPGIFNIVCDRYKTGNTTEAMADMENNSIKGNSATLNRIYVRDGEYTDCADWLAENGSMLFVYELATPQTVQLDPATIKTLIGNNTVWTDTNGTNTVVYLKKA